MAISRNGAFAAAQLVERLLPTPEIRSSKLATAKNLFGKIIVCRHIPRKVLNVEFDFNVRFSTLMQNLTSKIDKLGSRRRPTLS